MRTTATAVNLFLATNAFNAADGFQYQIRTAHRGFASRSRSIEVRRNMVPADAALWAGDVVDRLPSLTLADPVISGLTQAVSRPSPTVEAEILSDMSHVALDLFGFLNPERFLLRLSALLGRVMLMAADYDVDQYISTDEMLFQGGMLTLSLKQVLYSWNKMKPGFLPRISTEASFRDRAVYQVFFSPLGVSWLQFRTLVGNCIDWVEVKPNETVSTINSNGEHVAYWLYNGKVSVKHTNNEHGTEALHEMNHWRGKPINNQTIHKDFGLITGPGVLSALVDDFHDGTKDSNKTTEHKHNEAKLELTAGQEGATMMQINVAKLRELMEDDEKLDKVVRNVILLSIRNRMKTMMGEASNASAPVAV